MSSWSWPPDEMYWSSNTSRLPSRMNSAVSSSASASLPETKNFETVAKPCSRSVTVPPNTEAEVVLPDGRREVVAPGTATFHTDSAEMAV
jgi:hypothetical protein